MLLNQVQSYLYSPSMSRSLAFRSECRADLRTIPRPSLHIFSPDPHKATRIKRKVIFTDHSMSRSLALRGESRADLCAIPDPSPPFPSPFGVLICRSARTALVDLLAFWLFTDFSLRKEGEWGLEVSLFNPCAVGVALAWLRTPRGGSAASWLRSLHSAP